MILEMTLDYQVIISMTITVGLSYGVRKLIEPQSIYTLKLARRGRDIPDGLRGNLYYMERTRRVMDRRFVTVSAGGTIDDFMRIASERQDVACFLVEGPHGLVSFLTRDLALRPPGREGEPATLAEQRRHQPPGACLWVPFLNPLGRFGSAITSGLVTGAVNFCPKQT